MAKILLVEDEKVLREAFTILLRANGYEVDPAADGHEALKLWQSNRYQLVLLDLMMPVLDGVGFLQEAKPKTSAPETRIIVLSNLSSGDMPKQALQLGAHRHEVKANLAPKEIIEIVSQEMA